MKEFVDKLISRLEENSFDMSLENPDCKAVWTDKAIEIINELAEEYSANTPQKSANGWIACEKALPETYEYVLVWCKGRFIDGTCVGEECEWYGIGIMYGDKWTVYQCKDIRDIEVLAWQPLPQPYKPQKETEWKDKVMKHFTKTE